MTIETRSSCKFKCIWNSALEGLQFWATMDDGITEDFLNHETFDWTGVVAVYWCFRVGFSGAGRKAGPVGDHRNRADDRYTRHPPRSAGADDSRTARQGGIRHRRPGREADRQYQLQDE